MLKSTYHQTTPRASFLTTLTYTVLIMEASPHTASYRNPSPPPSTSPELKAQLDGYPDGSTAGCSGAWSGEDAAGGDRIGETVFSKSWVLSLLVKTLDCVSAQSQDCTEKSQDSLSMEGVGGKDY